MKKRISALVISVLFAVSVIGNIGGSISAYFNEKGNHWYYSDDKAFKYWGLTEVNDYGINISEANVDFGGKTPESIYVSGQEDYVVTAYVDSVETTFNAKIGLRGDVSINGAVDLYDVISISKYLIGGFRFDTEFHEFMADYNLDGVINLYDAIEISKTLIQNTISDNIEEKVKLTKYINQVLILVNNERTSRGLNALTLDPTISYAAQKRAVEISQMDEIDHVRLDGSKWDTILPEMNISCSFAGENIAAGYTSPKTVVEGWMNSTGHRANILNPDYEKIGLGYYEDANSSYKYYWSQLFIIE